MKPTLPDRLKVMIFPQSCANSTVWVAQCITHDFAAQGNSLEQAQQNFANTLQTHVLISERNNEAPFANVPPAPAWFERQFESASERTVKDVPGKTPAGLRQVIFKHVAPAVV